MSDWKTTLQGNVTDFGTQSAAGVAALPGGATSIELPGVCTTFTLQTVVGGQDFVAHQPQHHRHRLRRIPVIVDDHDLQPFPPAR